MKKKHVDTYTKEQLAIADQLCADVSKTASNELLGGREAGDNNEDDGKLNSPPLGSQKCPVCEGKGYYYMHAIWPNRKINCTRCKGTGAK